MKEAATVIFNEPETQEEALVIVRCDATQVAIAISRETGGDIEVVMGREDALKVLEALKIATKQ